MRTVICAAASNAAHCCDRFVLSQGDDFSRTGSLMSTTLQRLGGLAKYAGGGSNMCSLIAFVIVAFLAVWWFLLR